MALLHIADAAVQTLNDFLDKLSKPRNSGIMKNPYRDPVLLENLRHYLEMMLSDTAGSGASATVRPSGRRILLVGEALGFKGGRLTGIPFSSGAIYQRFDHPFLQALGPRLQIDVVDSENTATIVWDYLSRTGRTPLFWNAFPFHPHPKGERLKNRAPSAKEIQQGVRYLRALAELYRPDDIAGVGGKGTLCAQRAFPDRQVHSIRHPSYGGKADFIAGVERLYNSAG